MAGTDSDAIRAFFALPLPEPVRRAAGDVQQALRDGCRSRSLRWVAPENLHVTLRFLGDVAPQATAPLARSVAGALRGCAPFELELAELAAFPTPRRPRVVVLELVPQAPLRELAERVERGVVAAGLPPEARRFRGHVTLARVRGGRVRSPEPLPSPAATPFRASEVVLYRSELGPGGSRYTPLERLALGEDASP